jgi:hypothetical protein
LFWVVTTAHFPEILVGFLAFEVLADSFSAMPEASSAARS